MYNYLVAINFTNVLLHVIYVYFYLIILIIQVHLLTTW